MNEMMSVYRKNANNSLSINGPQGTDFLKRKLDLLNKFKWYNKNRNIFANYFAIVYVKYEIIKVRIYNHFPLVVKIKDRLFNHN